MRIAWAGLRTPVVLLCAVVAAGHRWSAPSPSIADRGRSIARRSVDAKELLMRRAAMTIGAAALLAISLLGRAAVPAAAYATPAQAAVVEQPFYADSGDGCPRGYAQGVLVWRTDGDVVHVDAVGEVVDRADPKNPACGDDGRYTVATITVYEDVVPGGLESRTVDNGSLGFNMPIDGNTHEAYFDRVVVVVCRASTQPLPAYCGTPQEYWPPR
jgi:hypothetical protein